jgi:hypothetical protein
MTSLLRILCLGALLAALSHPASASPLPQPGAQLAALSKDLVGTYFYYDRRDHGYAFHLQLEPDGTAYYMEQADDGNSVRRGTWTSSGGTVTVKLAGETKTLTRDDYGQLIERCPDGVDRFFFNIRRSDQP